MYFGKRFFTAGLCLFIGFSSVLLQAQTLVRMRTTDQSNGLKDETVFYFTTGATVGFDLSYDAYKLFSTNWNAPALFTRHGNTNFSINAMPPLPGWAAVPLYLQSNHSHSFSIYANLSNADSSWTVSLHDSITDNYHDLRAGSYNVTYDTSQAARRFTVYINCFASLSPLADRCEDEAAFVLSGGLPEGGYYTGTGVTNDSLFDPSIAGPGTHTITYHPPNPFCDSLASQTMTVYSTPPIPAISQAGNQLLSSQTADHYQWYRNAILLVKDTTQSITISQTGTYTVVISDSNDCSAESAPFQVNSIGIEEKKSKLLYSITPNPGKGLYKLKLNQALTGSLEISITDTRGKQVLREFIPHSHKGEKIPLDLSDEVPGLYLLELRYNGGLSSERLIKQ